MRRLKKMNLILFCYCASITVVFIIAFFVYLNYISRSDIVNSNFHWILSEENVQKISGVNSGMISRWEIMNELVEQQAVRQAYLDEFIKNLPFLFLGTIMLFIFGTALLSKILNHQHEKQTLLIAKKLSESVEEDKMESQHPAIAEAYQKIMDRLNAYSYELTQLNSYVAHEQKNALSLLRAKLQLSSNPELTEYVDNVSNSLNDILILSTSADNVPKKEVDVALVCADVCDSFQRIYSNIIFDFDEYDNYKIIARDIWIYRAVSNLIDNAVKHGGTKIEVALANEYGSVIVSVKDNGKGISEEDEEGFINQNAKTTKLKKDGYGIGLSLVRHVCDMCGGICWAENIEPIGVRFSLIFPEA